MTLQCPLCRLVRVVNDRDASDHVCRRCLSQGAVSRMVRVGSPIARAQRVQRNGDPP